MKIRYVTNPEINNAHGYLLIKEDKAVLIDTGCRDQEIIDICKEEKVEITHIFITHSHFDHLMGLNEIMSAFPDAQLYIGEGDFEHLFSSEGNLSSKMGLHFVVEKKDNCHSIDTNKTLKTSIGEIECLLMKGHTEGTTFYKIEDNIFVGDTLFRDSLGFHTEDMLGCDLTLFDLSIKWLLEQTKGLNIYPGHHHTPFKVEEVLDNKEHQAYQENLI